MSNKARKKGEKFRERLDFKFVFHVSKVPHSGWEKLYVSLESVETGKTTAKTAKAQVQNGACRWPDAIIESTRMFHETRSNKYDAKLYKFIVGMSPTRVLGEITLNLADYVSSTSGVSPSFGLKNCSAGTVLHMKVQCLTSAEATPGESEQTKENNRAELSDDELDDSGTNSGVNLPPPTPSREQALARYNSDSSDASTPIATGNGKNPSSYDCPSPTPSVSGSGSGNSFNSRLEKSSKKDSKKLPAPAKAGRLSLPAKVSSEGEESRINSETIARLEQEMESLKQKISEQASILNEKDEEIGSLRGELEGKTQELQGRSSELEQVRVEKIEWEENHEALKVKLEDCTRVVDELQQELAQEKDGRSTLEKEWEEKNSELELCIRNLEKKLEDDGRKLEEMSLKNMELQNSLLEQEQTLSEVEHALSQKLVRKEHELKISQERCAELEGIDPDEVAALRNDVEELEADMKELTEENIDLIFKLNVAGKELSKLSGEADYLQVSGLEEKLNKFREDHRSSDEKVSVLERSNVELQSAKSALESRLKSSTEEIQALRNDIKASRGIHSIDREAFSGREMRLKERVEELQEKCSAGVQQLAKLQAELDHLVAENLEYKSRRDELESSLGSLEVAKSDMAYWLAELENESVSSRSLCRKLESDLGEKTQELQSKVVKISELESRMITGEALRSELENRIHDLESRDMLSTSRIVDLEVQISSAKREMSAMEARSEELEARGDALELEKHELGSKLKNEQENNRFVKEKLEGLMLELAEANAKLETEISLRSCSESKMIELGSLKVELEKSLSRFEDENLQLSERVAGLEAQLSFLTEEKMNKESEVKKLQDESEETRRRIEEMNSQSLQAKEAAEEHVSELERSVSLLEESLEKTRRSFDECMAGKKVAEAKLEESEQRLMAAMREAEERLKKEKMAALERHQAELQKLTEQMNAESGDKEQLSSQALIEASELRAQKLEWEELKLYLEDRLEEARSKLEQTVDQSKKLESELRNELHLAATRVSELQDEVKKMAGENTELRSKCESLEESIASVEAGKRSLELEFQEEKSLLERKLGELSEQLSESSSKKEELSERIQKLEKDQAASRALEVEHRCESIKLRRQNSEIKQKMSEQESEREELRKRLEGIEADVRKRRPGGGDENGKVLPAGNGVLARSLSKCNAKVGTREGQELLLLRDRVKSLELELKLKLAETESFRRKEASFIRRIEALEAGDGGDQQHQVPAELNSQEMLQKELQRLQQVNLQLQEKMNRFKEASRCGNTLETVASLETELAEALESNNMYKEQLRSAFATQQNVHAAALQNLGDVDQVVSDLLGYKRKSSELEIELGEMRERYLSMSLKFAQVEVEREELVMTIRSLKNGRKSPF